jgi:hypothetical protein
VNWLLPAQTLLDLIASQATPAARWAQAVDPREVRISVLSVAQARAAIARERDATKRRRLLAALDAMVSDIEADSGVRPLPFSAAHAALWASLIHDSALASVPQVRRQVLATAMSEGLTLVEAANGFTPEMQSVGALIHVL